jgi:hypothetical protein
MPKLAAKEIHRFPNQAIHLGNHIHWNILRLLQEVKDNLDMFRLLKAKRLNEAHLLNII